VSREPNSWRQKVHPAFLEIGELRRKLAEAQKSPPSKRIEAVRGVVAASAEKRDELLRRYPELSPRPSWMHVGGSGYKGPSGEEKSAHVLDWYFFKRFRIPLRLALERESQGDLKAHKQIVRAKDEFWQLGHGLRVTPFKTDETHSDLIELGLNLGLRGLTAEELADCFNSLCPCGKEHDADALKKQRRRVQKQLQTAWENSWRLTPPRERFAVFGANRYIARPYRPIKGQPYVEISRKGKNLEYIVTEGGISGYAEDAEFNFPEVLSRLPTVFFVRSIVELFEMFFPNSQPPGRPSDKRE
jgi:hypothetical protein